MVKPLVAKALRLETEMRVSMAAALGSEYPVGSPISWSRNGVHEGVVVSHAYYDRIKVRNTNTGNEVWIYAAIILE